MNKKSKSQYENLIDKKQNGIFYTENFSYILDNFSCDEYDDVDIIEPFVGKGDLLKWVKLFNKNINNVEIYDIQPNPLLKNLIKINLNSIQRDTILNPPSYKNKWIITNPPYLAKNKSNDKTLFNKYNQTDLYRIHISQIINDKCCGGILIIPLNFICVSNINSDKQLLNDFMSHYTIINVNAFKESVFHDTSVSVCSIQFKLSDVELDNQIFNINFYPKKESKQYRIRKKYNWIIGGSIYFNLKFNDDIKFIRLLKQNYNDLLNDDNYIITPIYIETLDGSTLSSKLKFSYKEKPFLGIQTDRCFLTIVVKIIDNFDLYSEMVDKAFYKQLIYRSNQLINNSRKKYDSMFLTNYRESKNFHIRKRISFKLCYNILHHIIFDMKKNYLANKSYKISSPTSPTL